MSGNSAALPAWEPCPRCGTSNAPGEIRCDKCGRRMNGQAEWMLSSQDEMKAPASSEPKRAEVFTLPVSPSLIATSSRLTSDPSEPPARTREVKHLPEGMRRQLRGKIHEFRCKQLNRDLPLQFEETPAAAQEPPVPAAPSRQHSPVQAPAPRKRNLAPPSERVVKPAKRQQSADQSELAFAAADSQSKTAPIMDVAPFQLRLLGHVIDLSISLFAMLLFLLPFRLMVGNLPASKFFFFGVAAAYLFLVSLYGFVFVSLAGATPSMKLLKLRIVNFDGLPAKRSQRVHRFLGAIAGVGSFFVGILWATVDEEGLAWQDRISKTFLSVCEGSASSDT